MILQAHCSKKTDFAPAPLTSDKMSLMSNTAKMDKIFASFDLESVQVRLTGCFKVLIHVFRLVLLDLWATLPFGQFWIFLLEIFSLSSTIVRALFRSFQFQTIVKLFSSARA